MIKHNAPLFLKPLMVERVWGGNRTQALFGKPIPAGKVIGETWELSDRPEAQSLIASGPHEGRTLRETLAANPEILGPNLLRHAKQFPLLVKYIDAGTALSVQVHPDDAGAAAYNDRGKSECWVVVHAEPGALITRGLKPGTTREQYQQAVRDDRVEDVLHSFTPQIGDVVALPAGMIHAIGAGLVVAEIQQNSDVTFRIHDYKRLGLDGKPRALHVEEAFGAIKFDGDFKSFEGDMNADTVTPLSSDTANGITIDALLLGRYFNLDRMRFAAGATMRMHQAIQMPRVLMAISGSGAVEGHAISAGQTALLPANLSDMKVDAGTAGLTILIGTPNQ